MRLVIWSVFVGLAISSSLPNREIGEEEARELYEKFKRDYKKDYFNDAAIDEHRFKIFKDNLKVAQKYQAEERGTAEYGITKFSDLTHDEFVAMYANLRTIPNTSPTPNVKYNLEGMPKEFDWRNHTAVNPVENQGSCGSCWAFSTMGSVEAQWAIKKGELLKLSKQQLVDCDSRDAGCNGGFPEYAYHELVRMGGVQAADTYNYTAEDGECELKPSKFVAYVNGSLKLRPNEELQAAWLAENGPMSVALNADPLQYYKGGVMSPSRCPVSGMNHAVLTVGYGGGWFRPYWIVKNSWGDDWGESGYFRIYRGKGKCGIHLEATSAVVI